jgi:hypothetical protein
MFCTLVAHTRDECIAKVNDGSDADFRYDKLLSWAERKPKAQMRFKIEHISTGTPCYLLARQLDAGCFAVSDTSTLGDVRICKWVSQPRATTHGNLPDLTVFAFQLHAASERALLATGSVVELRSV